VLPAPNVIDEQLRMVFRWCRARGYDVAGMTADLHGALHMIETHEAEAIVLLSRSAPPFQLVRVSGSRVTTSGKLWPQAGSETTTSRKLWRSRGDQGAILA
jgi:hypothetical protein